MAALRRPDELQKPLQAPGGGRGSSRLLAALGFLEAGTLRGMTRCARIRSPGAYEHCTVYWFVIGRREE
jgi:hypothetical protein